MGSALYFGPLLRVSSVEAVGLQNLKDSDVLKVASLEGRNILAMNTNAVKGQIEGLPWVKEATVRRSFPHSVVIIVVEREPIALWKVGGTMSLVDQEGVILGPASGARDLPVIIQQLDGKVLKPGDKVSADAVNLAIRLRETLPSIMGLKAKGFEYLTSGGLVLETDQGWRARFGDSEDFDAKLAVWKAILPKAQTTCLKGSHTDLRFGERPFFRCT